MALRERSNQNILFVVATSVENMHSKCLFLYKSINKQEYKTALSAVTLGNFSNL